MGSFMSKISRAGLTLVIIGAVLLGFSLGDALISFKPAVSFDGAYENGVKAGDHVSGRVPLLGDSFATLQTWTEDRSNNSRTPAKTSAVYYMFPAGESLVGVRVGSKSVSAANDLVDETYGWFSGGGEPSTVLELDARVAEMEEELAEAFREELKDYYGYTDQDLEELGTPLLIEPRAFTTIRVFCGAGAGLLLLGVLLLVLRWRKVSASLRRARADYDPDLG